MKRTLGTSGIEVSAMGMGCWGIGGPFWLDGKPDGYGNIDDEVSKQAIRKAVELGVNFFDTADVYGIGHSESILGEALRGIRDKVVIGTKFGFTYNEDIKHITGTYLSPQYIRWACQQSLQRLRTDYIDLYTLHVGSVRDEEKPAVMETMEKLKQEGLIRAYCWSSSNIQNAEYFVKNAKGAAIMHTLNVFSPNDNLLDICAKHNMASINIFPLAMGMLSGKFNERSVMPADDVRGSGHSWVKYFQGGKPKQEFLDKLAAVREILTSQGRTLAQGALAWIWAKGEHTIPIPGFKNIEQATENVKAMEFGALTKQQMDEIDRLLGALKI
jgi:aryl-alcohol dehydrogenase-like predicted oxidoreductase